MLDPDVLRVIFEHQRRYRGPATACLATWGRALVLSLMAGTIEEVRRESDRRLMALCCTIAKGDTLRAQWFYQDNQAATLMVWFAFLIVNVQRGVEMACRHIDAGPSLQESVAALKDKFGFAPSLDWMAAYDGPFLPAKPVEDLCLSAMNPEPRHTLPETKKKQGTLKQPPLPAPAPAATAAARGKERAP